MFVLPLFDIRVNGTQITQIKLIYTDKFDPNEEERLDGMDRNILGFKLQIKSDINCVQSVQVIICSFLLIEKNQKIKTANKFLKLFFISLQKNNSPDRIGVKQIFLFNASLRIIF